MVKQTILDVTLALVKEEGVQNVTIRRIASLAGVNIALINYHFGTKEKLIREVVVIILNEFEEALTTLDDTLVLPERRLAMFLKQYAVTIMKYPDILKQMLFSSTNAEVSQEEFGAFIKRSAVSRVTKIVAEITGETQTDKLIKMTLQIVTPVVLPAVAFDKLSSVFALDDASQHLDDYIDLLIQNYFYKYREVNHGC